MSKPPLELHAELVAPDGTRYRWAGDRTSPGDIPSGITFASKRFEGFERGSCQLNRPIDRDYPDLGLFDSFNLIGYDATVAYEGMLGQVPRSTPFGIGVETTGWMAHARHRKFREVYIDRDVSRWVEPGGTRRAGLLIGGFNPNVNSSDAPDVAAGPGWTLSIDGQMIKPHFERIYDAGPGVTIANISTNFRLHGFGSGDAQVTANAAVWDDDNGTGELASADLKASTSWSFSPTTPKRYGSLKLFYSLAGLQGSAGVSYGGTWQQPSVTGAHGLQAYPNESGLAGFYASDVIRDICSRFCPRLDPSGVQGTTWPVAQAVWHDRTDPYDAWLELNKYHLWELAVWEDRVLHYGPSDLTDYDWEVRATDPGVSVELQGDSTDHLANFCVVQFQNVLTGGQDEVGPDTHPELRDLSVENPANRNGLDVEFGITLSDPTDPDSAAQIGRAALAENNQPRAIGTITFRGHIRDRAGHWQPGWKVRATDVVAITDWPNNRPRLIGEIEWDQTTKTGRIAVDATLNRVDAFLDRQSTALRAAGL